MGAQATRLSDVKVKAAKPKEKDYILTDGNGLQMRVRINGSKLWNFNYIQPVTKKRINMGLGTFPEVSLAQARKRTVEARELVAQGGWTLKRNATPSGTRKKQPRNTLSKISRQRGSSSKRIQSPLRTPRIFGVLSRCMSSLIWQPPPSLLSLPLKSSICSARLRRRAASKPLNV